MRLMNFKTRLYFCYLIVPMLLWGNATHSDEAWVIRGDGVGAAKIGMTLVQLNEALHEKFVMPQDKAAQGCFYVNPSKHPHIGFMIEEGKLVRVDVDAPELFTVQHVQVGDSEAKVVRAYGHRLKASANPYVPPKIGHYLTVLSNDGRCGIRFEMENGKVRTYYAGTDEAIQYVEGCE